MSFSFCLNKNEMLTLCGLSLLYHGLDLRQEGKLMQDGNRLVVVVIKFLTSAKAPGAADFKKLAASMISPDGQLKQVNGRTENGLPVPTSVKPAAISQPSTKSNASPSAHQKQLHSLIRRHTSAAMSESDLLSQQEKLRRVTLPHVTSQNPESHHYNRSSTDSSRSDAATSNRENRASVPHVRAMMKPVAKNHKLPNLDYLSLNTPGPMQSHSSDPTRLTQVTQASHGSIVPTSAYSGPKTTAEPSEWEALLGSFDDRNLYDAIYGGPGAAHVSAGPGTSNYGSWSPDSWDYTPAPMGDFANATTTQSVLSLSDESLSSGEEVSTAEQGLSDAQFDYKDHFLSEAALSGDAYRLLYDGLDGNFGL
jgi:hypothetical protein